MSSISDDESTYTDDEFDGEELVEHWDEYFHAQENISPFRRACEDGDTEIVATLLKNGAYGDGLDILYPAYVGISMLNRTMIWACINGDVEAGNILLNRGAILIDADHEHYPPLHYACMHGHAHVVNVLLEKGADITFDTNHWRNTTKKNTPLLLACKYGHVDVVELLLNNGADVNENIQMSSYHYIGTKFCRFNTPLYIAWMSSNSDVIKLLIKRGAKTEVLW